jgi:cyanate permease
MLTMVSSCNVALLGLSIPVRLKLEYQDSAGVVMGLYHIEFWELGVLGREGNFVLKFPGTTKKAEIMATGGF